MNLTEHLRFPAPLDPGFEPVVWFNKNYAAAARASGLAVPLVLGLERENGLWSRYETVVLPMTDPSTLRYVERLVKFLLWARGGWKLYRRRAPQNWAEYIRQTLFAAGRPQV